jgi:hypothetical protein
VRRSTLSAPVASIWNCANAIGSILGHGREGAIRHKVGGKDLPVPRTEFQRARGELHHKRVAILLNGDLAWAEGKGLSHW